MAFVSMWGKADAGDVVVHDIEIPRGGSTVFEVELANGTTEYSGFEFDLTLCDGVTVATNAAGRPVIEKGARLVNEDFTLSISDRTGWYKILGYYSDASPIPGESGTVASITLLADENTEAGTSYQATLSNIVVTKTDATTIYLEDIVFNITIVEPQVIILDENSEEIPEASDGEVNVKVIRTIKAGVWNTICLPFNMSPQQTKTIFGEDVQLAAFDSYEVEYDDDDNIISILVAFENIVVDDEGFVANYPYMIKTSQGINEFTLRTVLDPDEDECYSEYDNGRTGKNRHVYGTFYGTYHAQTTVPANCLFVSNNKFWYSTGLTKMKAFRGYFEFEDVLSSLDNAEANISLNFDMTSGIREILNQSLSDGAVYTIQGQFVGKDIDLKKLPRGIYIVNGKKQVIK